MDDTIEERLTAVERAVTDGDHDLADLATAAETGERLADLDAEMQTLDERVAELEAATQALRGYVGGVRAVNEDVERRADLALATAEAAAEAADGACVASPRSDGAPSPRSDDAPSPEAVAREVERDAAGEGLADGPSERSAGDDDGGDDGDRPGPGAELARRLGDLW